MSQISPRLFIALYLDEDVTSVLASALRNRGYQAQSTAEANNLGRGDEFQLLYATERDMAVLTYNAQDFIPLARKWYFAGRTHAGIIVSPQFERRQFGELLRQTLNLMNGLTRPEIYNQVVFLQQFKWP